MPTDRKLYIDAAIADLLLVWPWCMLAAMASLGVSLTTTAVSPGDDGRDEDFRLLGRARTGEAFGVLMARFQKRVHGLALRVLFAPTMPRMWCSKL